MASVMTKKKIPLVALRAELNVRQKDVAKEADLPQTQVSYAETGKKVARYTAYKILFAYNRLRAQRGLPELEFDDIAWNLEASNSE